MNKYQPSSGTEGMMFISKFCEQCRNEKFMHTQKEGDLTCDILTRSMVHGVKDKEYPAELQYNEDGTPICTMFKKHIWHDSNDEIIEPEDDFIDPDQLELF